MSKKNKVGCTRGGGGSVLQLSGGQINFTQLTFSGITIFHPFPVA